MIEKTGVVDEIHPKFEDWEETSAFDMLQSKDAFLLCLNKYKEEKAKWMDGDILAGKILSPLARLVEKAFLEYKIATYYCIHDTNSSQRDIMNTFNIMERMQDEDHYKGFVLEAIEDQFNFLFTM